MRKRYYLLFTILIFGLALLVAACGPAQDPDADVDSEPVEVEGEESDAEVSDPVVESDEEATDEGDVVPPSEPQDAGPPPDFAGLDYSTTESGLQYVITEEGSGDQPVSGDVVRVHYTGILGDGTEFDSSAGRDPFQFALGRNQVIPGWDEGIGLLQEGGSAKLVIPPELGYGTQGAGNVIPPNATLYFDVELLEVLPGGPDEPTAVEEDEYETTESGLRYYVIEEGDGEMAEEGNPVSVHYTAWLSDGTRLNSSIDTGEPLTFVLGEDQVFPGLNEGVALMRVGGQRQLLIPPDLGFGEEGAGTLVPPDSTLLFEVELLEVLPAPPEEPAAVDEDEYTTTESGLQYVDLEEGTGEEVVSGQRVTVNYTGWLAEDGTRFDSSFSRGEPFAFVAGGGQVIPGWDEGVIGMQEGGRRQLLIPADLAYGEQGAGGVIPPNADLIFEVEVLEVGE